MPYDDDSLHRIYDRTSGYCHLCRKKLDFQNYARPGRKGAWEVEHSRPVSKGGSSRLSNLYAACIPCNREKGVRNTRTARGYAGKRYAPHSRQQRVKARRRNALAGGLSGAVIGSIFGPPGILLGSLFGGNAGYSANPDKWRD